jgi:hypothetical protein
VEPLSPFRAAQDRAIIAGCLAEVMAAAGAAFTLESEVAEHHASTRRPAQDQMTRLDRARAMRSVARDQRETAEKMRAHCTAIRKSCARRP